MATFKCKYCDSDDELHFEQPYKKGNRPVRALDGQNHKCKQNANPQIGETKKKVWKNDRTQFIYNREGKFKFGCDAPKEKTPTFRLCGNCKDGTEVFQYLSEEACQCKLLGFHTCQSYCPICRKHPNTIYITNKKLDYFKSDKPTLGSAPA